MRGALSRSVRIHAILIAGGVDVLLYHGRRLLRSLQGTYCHILQVLKEPVLTEVAARAGSSRRRDTQPKYRSAFHNSSPSDPLRQRISPFISIQLPALRIISPLIVEWLIR